MKSSTPRANAQTQPQPRSKADAYRDPSSHFRALPYSDLEQWVNFMIAVNKPGPLTVQADIGTAIVDVLKLQKLPADELRSLDRAINGELFDARQP